MPCPRSIVRIRRAAVFAGFAAVLVTLAASPPARANVIVTFSAGTLAATSDADDPILVACVGGNAKVNGGDATPPAPCADVVNLVVTGGPGANAIDLVGVTGTDFTSLESSIARGGGDVDAITGSTIADRIIGDTGADTMSGGDGDDVLVWNNGDGSDVMNGEVGGDTVEVNGSGAAGDQFTVNPNGERVRFDRVNLGLFSLDIGTTESLVLNGGGGDDTMTGAAGLAALITTTMNGQDGNDALTGTDGADTQAGGAGNDRLVGFRGNDLMSGGDGDDVLVWNNGDGSDVMNGEVGGDTVEVNGSGAAGDQFTVNPNGERVRFDRVNLGLFSLDIGTTESLVLNGGGGDDTMTGAAGLAALITTTMNGQDGNDALTGTDGADTQAGGAGNDRLVGFRGNDLMSGGDGDDVLVWNNGDGSDVMNGEVGGDTVEVNGSGAAGDQFTVNPNGERVRFDRVNLGLFSLDIGTTESLVLNGGGGDDTMTGAAGLAALITTTMNGQDGNDSLTGTDGSDALDGGAGDDELRSRDKAADEVACGTGEDFGRVDPRDHLTGCETVRGGRKRVRLVGNVAKVVRGRAIVRLRCAAVVRCRGTVQLRRGNRVLGTARFRATSRKAKTVRVKLNKRGRRLVARAPGARMKIRARIDARDSAGNGWRTTPRITLKR